MNPKFLKPHENLTATQRKSLGLHKTPPRERHPDEAQPRIYVNATQFVGKNRSNSYTGAELKEAPARAGTTAAHQIKTRGFSRHNTHTPFAQPNWQVLSVGE